MVIQFYEILFYGFAVVLGGIIALLILTDVVEWVVKLVKPHTKAGKAQKAIDDAFYAQKQASRYKGGVTTSYDKKTK